MNGDARLRAGAVHAQASGRPEALDAELPGLVVEAHRRLAARASRQLDEGERQVAQDERAVRLVDARRGGDVAAIDEDVEQLARASRGGAVGACAGGLQRVGGDDNLEAHVLDRDTLGNAPEHRLARGGRLSGEAKPSFSGSMAAPSRCARAGEIEA